MLFMMSGGSARLVPSLRDLAAEPDNRFGNFLAGRLVPSDGGYTLCGEAAQRRGH